MTDETNQTDAPEKSSTEEKKIVAWMVYDDDEGSGTVVFHGHGIAARKIGAEKLDLEFEYAKCRRTPELDKYTYETLTPEILVKEHGWYCECFNCSNRVHEDEENVDVAVFIGHAVYCSQECKDDHGNRIARINSEYEQFQIAIMTHCLKVEIVGFDGGYPQLSPTAYFTFPGAKYIGTIHVDMRKKTLMFFVPYGDLETYNAWINKVKWNNHV